MCVCVRVLLVVLGVNMEKPCVKLVCLMIGETGFALHVRVYFRLCVRVEDLSVCSLYLRRVNISQCDATLMMQDESSCAEGS